MTLEIIPCVCFGLPCMVMIIFIIGSFLSFSNNERIKKIGDKLLDLISN